MLELHEARHEGAAGEAVGPVQPPDPGAQHVPQELEPLAVHALLYVHAKEGHKLLAGRRGEAEALRHVRGVRPVQALPDLHARGGSPVQVVVQLRGAEVQVQDPADGLLGAVVLAQLGVVGLSEGLEDAAQPTHDGGPHVLVGLLVDEVNGSLAGRVPQHGVPGGPGQRDVVDGVDRLRPEGVPVALHHVRQQGQDVGGNSRGTLGRSPTP